MNILDSIIRKIGHKAMVISGTILLSMMVLIVSNVVLRGFGGVIAGSYELIEVLIIVVVAGALGYTELEKSHVTVQILVSRFSPRVKGIFEFLIYFLGAGTWAVIVWTGIEIFLKRWLNEKTYLLEVPLFPFRIVWLIGLIFLCIVLLLSMVKGFNKAVKK